MLEINLPSRLEFKAALAESRIDPTEKHDLRLVFNSCESWLSSPRPRFWHFKFGGMNHLPQGLGDGVLHDVIKCYFAIRAHCQAIQLAAAKRRGSHDDPWQSWSEVMPSV